MVDVGKRGWFMAGNSKEKIHKIVSYLFDQGKS
jgi:hypothetical protein